MLTMDTLIYGLALVGAMVNAASGVLEAGRKRFDLFGMVVVALAAALGGGTLRDILLDRTVFWIAEQSYLIAALVAGVGTFILARLVRLPARLFLLPDALQVDLSFSPAEGFGPKGPDFRLLFGTASPPPPPAAAVLAPPSRG